MKSACKRVITVCATVLAVGLCAFAFQIVKVEIVNDWSERFAKIRVGDTRVTTERVFGEPFEQSTHDSYDSSRYAPSACPFVLEVTFDDEDRVVNKEIIELD